MCWRLEFNRHSKMAKNKMTCCRLTLNIIGLFVVLAIGAVAAIFATYSRDWFPVGIGNDGRYRSIVKYDGRVMELDSDNIDDCMTDSTFDPSKMMGRLVYKCGTEKLGYCIPLSLRCDGYNDCLDNNGQEDNSDEVACGPFCASASRKNLRFECDVMSGNQTQTKCFNTDYRCDGEVDCTGDAENNNDESSCDDTFKVLATDLECSTENSYVCSDNTLCIRPDAHCNGVENCYDGSDEQNCS